MSKYILPMFIALMFLVINPVCLASSPEQATPSIRQLWEMQELGRLKKGEFSLSDTAITDTLAKQLQGHPDIQDIKLTALDNNRIRIELSTLKYKKITLEGTIEEFYHDKQSSHLKFKIMKKSLSDKSLIAWLFSRLSISFLTQTFGDLDFPEDLKVTIKRNTISIDFHDALTANAPKLGAIAGVPIPEIVKINRITSSAGFIHISTSLDVANGFNHYLNMFKSDKF